MNTNFCFNHISRLKMTGLLLILLAGLLHSQITSLKLQTSTDTLSSFRILNSDDLVRMRINADGGFYLGATFGSGNIPVSGGGTRFMWYPKKAAFRTGQVSTSQWNDANIGDYSAAMGFGTIASGSSSAAFGNGTTASGGNSLASGIGSTASGNNSTAMGGLNVASGNNSFAAGAECQASQNYSVAIGSQSVASGIYSTALGRGNTASGESSLAIGFGAEATGRFSVAIGYGAEATGNYSVALGSYVMTSGKTGVFIIGDSAAAYTQPYRDNQFIARFKGGYRLYTDNSANCVYLDSGATSWAHISDSAKKELFAPVEGDYFLNSLAKLRLGSWNYKSQQPLHFRHYGPMAQEIFRYFGKDKYGTIGNDTTIATADMDGIMMICLQALEKRTSELNSALNDLKKANEKLTIMEKNNSEIQKRIEKLEQNLVSALAEKDVKFSSIK